MYPLISRLSFILRFLICRKTIEQIPILSNPGAEWILGQVLSIYTIFRLICFFLVWIIIEKRKIKNPSTKSLLYFVLYLPLIGIYRLILLLLTHLNILPISI